MKMQQGYSIRKIGSKYYAVCPARVAEAGEMIALNETGVFLWELLEKETGMDEILRAMMERYGIDAETAQRDTAAYMEMLKEVGALA